MRHEKVREVATVSILARKRFQFVTAILIGALVPWLMRAFLPGKLIEAASLNTLQANAIAIIVAFWMRQLCHLPRRANGSRTHHCLVRAHALPL